MRRDVRSHAGRLPMCKHTHTLSVIHFTDFKSNDISFGILIYQEMYTLYVIVITYQ